MKKVFLLYEIDWEYCGHIAIFSTLEKAEEAKAVKKAEASYYEYAIQEYVVDDAYPGKQDA